MLMCILSLEKAPVIDLIYMKNDCHLAHRLYYFQRWIVTRTFTYTWPSGFFYHHIARPSQCVPVPFCSIINNSIFHTPKSQLCFQMFSVYQYAFVPLCFFPEQMDFFLKTSSGTYSILIQMSRVMGNRRYGICEQKRFRWICASAQSRRILCVINAYRKEHLLKHLHECIWRYTAKMSKDSQRRESRIIV